MALLNVSVGRWHFYRHHYFKRRIAYKWYTWENNFCISFCYVDLRSLEKTKANAKIVLFFGHVNRKNDRISALRHDEFWPPKVDVVKSLYASALVTSSQRWQQCQKCLYCSDCFILNYQVGVWNCAGFYLAWSIMNLRTRLTTWKKIEKAIYPLANVKTKFELKQHLDGNG